VAVGEESASKRLVAYVVTRDCNEVNGGDLRRLLRQQLPALMIPVAFVRLDTLPLTGSGKIDRMSLPTPSRDISGGAIDRDGSSLVEPRTYVERKLGEIWGTVLEVSGISIFDDFLDIGGTSVLALQCVSRIRQELQVDVPIEMFLGEAANLRALSEFIENRMKMDGQDSNMDVS